ncbi:hypothetical protein Y032_0016g2965 [Ancylostoma ceylanicum]|uniref:Reverse transcriptase domain-containing protein n=1 Tax=Ancylostoma ceylanicum TaxID=53326 RepID=A0A016V6B2_9BILA|nr:hypothetical protein Y032_0016g2965 [Ancylostoma ceylanicum]
MSSIATSRQNLAILRQHHHRVRRGVPQGDTSSPKIFTAALEAVMSRLEWDNMGVRILAFCALLGQGGSVPWRLPHWSSAKAKRTNVPQSPGRRGGRVADAWPPRRRRRTHRSRRGPLNGVVLCE